MNTNAIEQVLKLSIPANCKAHIQYSLRLSLSFIRIAAAIERENEIDFKGVEKIIQKFRNNIQNVNVLFMFDESIDIEYQNTIFEDYLLCLSYFQRQSIPLDLT